MGAVVCRAMGSPPQEREDSIRVCLECMDRMEPSRSGKLFRFFPKETRKPLSNLLNRRISDLVFKLTFYLLIIYTLMDHLVDKTGVRKLCVGESEE